MTLKTLHLPAYLFVGNNEHLSHKVEILLAHQLCPQHKAGRATDGNCFCTTCRQIKNNQHANIIWLSTENGYTTKDIDIIFAKITFALQPDEHFYFVINDAHMLNATCANRLLKSVEEPPPGYHFIFLTSNEQAVLPTITSRCLIEHTQTEEAGKYDRLVSFFVEGNKYDPLGFEKELNAIKPNNTVATQIVSEVMNNLITQLKQSPSEQTNKLLDVVQKFMAHPPMSGSGPLFLKSLYMNINQCA